MTCKAIMFGIHKRKSSSNQYFDVIIVT